MNKFDLDEIIIKNALEESTPNPPELTPSEYSQISHPQHRHMSRRARIAALVAAVILIPTITVAAAIYSSYSKLLSDVEPQFSEYLEQVETACESSGIRMELVAYTYDGYNLMAYVNLEDTEGLGRLKEDGTTTTPIFRLFGDSSDYGVGFVIADKYYDEETEILTYGLITEISDISECTLQLGSIIYDCAALEIDTGIELSGYIGIYPEVEDVNVDWTNVTSDTAAEDIPDEDEPVTVIARDAMDISISDLSNCKISNMGFYGGMYHIQACYDNYDEAGIRIHASNPYLYLRDSDGTELYSYLELSYADEYDDSGMRYIDYAFAVTEDTIGDYSLIVEAIEYSEVKGFWDITIPVSQGDMNVKTADCSIMSGNFRAERVVVSEFGVLVHGTQLDSEMDCTDLTVTLNCGDERLELYCMGGSRIAEDSDTDDPYESGRAYSSWSYSETWGKGYGSVDIDSIDSITLDDYTINFDS